MFALPFFGNRIEMTPTDKVRELNKVLSSTGCEVSYQSRTSEYVLFDVKYNHSFYHFKDIEDVFNTEPKRVASLVSRYLNSEDREQVVRASIENLQRFTKERFGFHLEVTDRELLLDNGMAKLQLAYDKLGITKITDLKIEIANILERY